MSCKFLLGVQNMISLLKKPPPHFFNAGISHQLQLIIYHTSFLQEKCLFYLRCVGEEVEAGQGPFHRIRFLKLEGEAEEGVQGEEGVEVEGKLSMLKTSHHRMLHSWVNRPKKKQSAIREYFSVLGNLVQLLLLRRKHTTRTISSALFYMLLVISII